VYVKFIDDDGTERQVRAEPGCTLMEAAVKNGVPGVVAECGGYCICGTCHVYVQEDWQGRLPKPGVQETEMLGYIELARSSSRLSCQILLSDDQNGLTVRTPRSQH
jgi:2Fe-2S ferredoxin